MPGGWSSQPLPHPGPQGARELQSCLSPAVNDPLNHASVKKRPALPCGSESFQVMECMRAREMGSGLGLRLHTPPHTVPWDLCPLAGPELCPS